MAMLIQFLLLSVTIVTGLQITEEQYHSFPRLFHLDDYERCLMKQDGVYCVGTFALTASEDNLTFKLMKAYSENPLRFNRTRLHRGYCISERCAPQRNSTLRFERCVAKHIQKHSLTPRVETAECTTRKQREAEAKEQPDSTQHLFVVVVCVILLLNALGTLCDACSGQNNAGWRLLRCWSLYSSWRKLVAIEDDDAHIKPLATIHGFRTVGLFITIWVHVLVMRSMLYVYRPHYIEEIMVSNFSELMSLSVSMLHSFAMVSSFLTTYFITTLSEKYSLSIKVLPLAILKRFFRTYPVNILLLGFVTTWWVRLGSGPLWSVTVGSECHSCRKDFWAYAIYVNNFVNSRCLLPAWYLAADFQTNIVVSGLALMLPRQGRKAMFIVGAILITSCAVVSTVVYSFGWEPLNYRSPESLRTVFKDNSSYQNLHLSSWIMLPSCFVGMFCAYLYDVLQKEEFKFLNNRWVKVIYPMAFPVLAAWMVACSFVDYTPSSTLAALLEGFQRPMFSIYIGLTLVASFHFRDIQTKFLSHHFWCVLSRLSLPVMLVHWVVLKSWVGASMYAVAFTYWICFSDWVVVLVVSYIISIPIAVLLEVPAQKFMGTLLFRQELKEKKN